MEPPVYTETAPKYSMSMPYYIVEYRRPALYTFYFLWMLLTLWFILCLTRMSYYSGDRIVWIALIPFPNDTARNVTERLSNITASSLVNDTVQGNLTNVTTSAFIYYTTLLM